MDIPAYYLPRPPMPQDKETLDAFAELFATQVAPGAGADIDYQLAAPKWQFLCYLTDTRHLLLHGSGNHSIAEFEPRQSNDIHEFGARKAIYAASDGIWPMYFAIVNRDIAYSLMNACIGFVDPPSGISNRYYYFSVNEDALPQHPWHTGMVYVLPSNTFEQEAPGDFQGLTLEKLQWASPVSVKPLAKLAVGPEDFPFLAEMNGHNIALVMERAGKNPNGFPWRD